MTYSGMVGYQCFGSPCCRWKQHGPT